MKLTLKDAVDGFRKQWNWMADETLKRKRKIIKNQYFDEHDILRNIPLPHHCCYLCEFSKMICVGDAWCNKCPIEWGGKIGNCYHKDRDEDYKGLFSRWEKTTDYEEAARLARKIANLPLKEKYRKEYENAID